MTTDRLSTVLAAMAGVTGDSPTVIDRMCEAAIDLLGLNGAGISLMVDGRLQGSAGASDSGIAAVQELQLELGEGPCLDAWARNEPVGETDLAHPTAARWPAFCQAAVAVGVRSVFAFPLRQGAIRTGVLVFYRARPGMLEDEDMARGVVLADLASQVVLALQAGAPEGQVHELLAGEPPHWAAVHQATGMVAGQLGVSMDDAFLRLRGYGFGECRTLRDVANDVVARRLRFDTEG